MKRLLYSMFTLAIAILFSASLLAQNKAKDSFGKVDKAEVILKQVRPNHFSFELTWDNDQKLAAMTYPLIVKGKDFKMHYDSVSWKGRAEYFSVKSARPIDSLQQVLIGFIYDLGQGNTPLVEAKGTMATIYFTAEPNSAKKLADVCDISVDTTFIPPSNVLHAVTPDGQHEIHPNFGFVRIGAGGQPSTCK
jgi:hypothetical protein